MIDRASVVMLHALGTDGTGLTTAEVIRRRRQYGANVLPERRRPGVFVIAAEELENPLLVLLALAAVAAILMGERIDGAFILVTLAITAGFGIVMALRAERARDALQELLHPVALVIRDSREMEVGVEGLVPDDRILLRRGMRVPADARVIDAQSLEVDESMLTGESVPVRKAPPPTSPQDGGEGTMLFQGTLVVEGQGAAVVTATGAHTKLAGIATSLAEPRERTPLQEQLARFAKAVALTILAIATVLMVIGVVRGIDAGMMFATAIAVAVAAVPEGLAVAVTAVLAVGTVRLARQRCLVRRIIAAETLGSVGVILTDKTGTLTEGRMRVVAVHTYDGEVGEAAITPGMQVAAPTRALLEAGVMGTEVSVANPYAPAHEWTYIGSGTEAALVGAAGIAGMHVLGVRASVTVVDRLPFSVERKFSATLIERSSSGSTPGGTGMHRELILLGAPERIVPHRVLPDAVREELEVKGREGFRVVGAAVARVAASVRRIGDCTDPTAHAILLGLYAIRDPLRDGAARALAAAQVAGVRTVMVTGDYPATAKRIAEDVGLAAGEPRVMTGDALAALDDAALAQCIADVDVFARTSHAQKARLVHAWQARGASVAVTGDGVNDAPALITADVGVAMGSGSDIAREAADLVLLDDQYETIVTGIQGGRTMWDNIRKTAHYLLFSSFSEVVLVAASVVSGMPILVLPAQILWVNLIEDTLPAAALAFEPPERGVMHEPPRSRSTPLVDRAMRWLVLGAGLTTNVLLVAAGFFILRATGDLALTRTIVFGALAADSLLFAFAVRSLRQPIWHTRPWENWWLLGALACSTALLLIGLLMPIARPLLRTVPVPLWGWGVIVGLSLLNLVAIEIVKAVVRWRQHAAVAG